MLIEKFIYTLQTFDGIVEHHLIRPEGLDDPVGHLYNIFRQRSHKKYTSLFYYYPVL